MKTAVIIGRFQPITIAHYNIIYNAISSYSETYIVVINSIASIVANGTKHIKPGSKIKSFSANKLQLEKDLNPFSGMTRKKLIYKAFGGKLHESKIISHSSANIEQIINKIYYSSKNTKFVIVCGEDRKSGYEAQIKGAFEKKYFAPEIESVEIDAIKRDIISIDNISATLVRNTLKDDDFEKFCFLTPKGIHSEYSNLRRVFMQEASMVPFFKKMLVEMTHIEDLKVEDFINFIKNIYESEASIKLDGTTALAFGFDENGKFYTGFGRDFKDIKPELRRYSVEDWFKQKNIFNNPAISAHTFLEKNIPIIKKYVKPGELVLSEILFGDKPNCIKYDFSGINYIVILNNDKLAEELNGKKMNIDTVNYIIETDTIIPKAVKQVWKYGTIQKVDPKKYNINIEEELKELEIFLNSSTDGIRNIDIIGMKAVGKNKELINKVREKAQLFKLNIKEKLLQQFVRKVRDGEYVPADGYSHEGIVLKLGNERIKIIDKNVFTAIHDRDWEPVVAAKKIQKSMPKDEAIKEINKMIDNFDKLYPNISDDVKIKMKNQLQMTKIFIQTSE